MPDIGFKYDCYKLTRKIVNFETTGCPQSLDTWEIILMVMQTDLLHRVHLNFEKRDHKTGVHIYIFIQIQVN